MCRCTDILGHRERKNNNPVIHSGYWDLVVTKTTPTPILGFVFFINCPMDY